MWEWLKNLFCDDVPVHYMVEARPCKKEELIARIYKSIRDGPGNWKRVKHDDYSKQRELFGIPCDRAQYNWLYNKELEIGVGEHWLAEHRVEKSYVINGDITITKIQYEMLLKTLQAGLENVGIEKLLKKFRPQYPEGQLLISHGDNIVPLTTGIQNVQRVLSNENHGDLEASRVGYIRRPPRTASR